VRAWIVIVSVVVGTLAGFVGYLAWIYSDFVRWWPWAGAGGMIGLAVGLSVSGRFR
jgi:hypothetical protein